ncbi:hypothetical protein HPP92_008025 [Vanilla planifolia]|uniref:Uncharacterized protein n=1 Tax=Vanilla planifolia TaxID=51239 RepID=A0A835RHN0_VANPL|nr:hypothetical protein HPP92_008052 [Vanilla planifolia]KAG0491162.1 hypothetical protein HPP92_008025 [Vanilla planifolia]
MEFFFPCFRDTEVKCQAEKGDLAVAQWDGLRCFSLFLIIHGCLGFLGTSDGDVEQGIATARIATGIIDRMTSYERRLGSFREQDLRRRQRKSRRRVSGKRIQGTGAGI